MTGWQGLRVDLRRLLEESPDALVAFPDPESERSERRFRIELAAWATEIAARSPWPEWGSQSNLTRAALCPS